MEHGAYFKTKAFAWVLVWTGCLIRPASLIENIYIYIYKKKKKKMPGQ